MLFDDVALLLMFRYHIPLVWFLLPLITSFLVSSSMISISFLVRWASIPLSQSFPRDIKTLSFMDENMWHDRACEGMLISFSSDLWLDFMVSPLGKASVTALVVGFTLCTSALLAVQWSLQPEYAIPKVIRLFLVMGLSSH